MARFVMANRRAGKFHKPEKLDSRKVLDAAVHSVTHMATLIHDFIPEDPLARRVLVFDADPGEMAAITREMSDDVILEPEILHWTEPTIPMDFVDMERSTLASPMPVGTGPRLPVRVRGNGVDLWGAKTILFLRGPGGLRTNLEDYTDKNGTVTFTFQPIWQPAALVVAPAGEFWSIVLRGPSPDASGEVTVDCPPLPQTGPLEWWHRVLGIANHDATRGEGIRVGVTDTGVGPHACLNHVQDIGAFIDGQKVPPPNGADVDSHGSHVCGIIGARPTHQDQFAGIAPGAEVISARVFPPDMGANQGDIANAIDELSIVHQVDLINMSLGTPQPSQIVHDAIIDALERGTLCVCAAANSAGPVKWPAAFPETVAVSALGVLGWGPAGTLAAGSVPGDPTKFGDENLYLANFSCFGPEITCGGPGVGIISTVPERFDLTAPYASMGGTSMASPAACGALAVLLSQSPDYGALSRDKARAEKARTILRTNSRDIGLEVEFQGHGVPEV